MRGRNILGPVLPLSTMLPQVREYNIQRELVHPRIVRLLDLFEIDAMSFATVLEVAPGGDLASHLQLHPVCAHGA
jgi:serine/threonine protein kinase